MAAASSSSSGTNNSAASAVSASSQKVLDKVKEVNLKEKAVQAAEEASKKAMELVDSTVSAIYTTIKPVIDEFKKIPPKLKSAVDVQGAAAGVYAKFDTMQKSVEVAANNILVSSEVAITSADYYANPSDYPNLQSIQYSKNIVTNADCLSSGYTKVEQTINQQWLQKFKEQLGLPVEERDVVEQQMETLFNATVKTTWDTVGPLVKTVGSMAQIDTIQDLVKGMSDAIDGVVKLISSKVDEKALDNKLAQQNMQKVKAKNDVDAVKTMKSNVGSSLDTILDTAGKAADAAKDQITGATSAVKDIASGLFKNLKMPEMPNDIKQTFTDLYDAIILVMNNISNIYIVLILRLIGKIFDCFNQIIGIIGVPTIPDPLGKIPQIISDAQQVMTFVLGLPVTLINCIKSIAKKKIKAMQVATLPTPPEPVKTKTPVPPTSQDVQVPSLSWNDIITKLKEDYMFSATDASRIVNDIQKFYDGSGKEEAVIKNGTMSAVSFEDGRSRVNYMPATESIKRIQILPLFCNDTWLGKNVKEYTINGEKTYMLSIPHKGEYNSKTFYKYSSYDSKEYYNASNDFGLHLYSSQLK